MRDKKYKTWQVMILMICASLASLLGLAYINSQGKIDQMEAESPPIEKIIYLPSHDTIEVKLNGTAPDIFDYIPEGAIINKLTLNYTGVIFIDTCFNQ